MGTRGSPPLGIAMSRRFDGLLFTIGLLLLWELLYRIVGSSGLSSPITTLVTVAHLLGSGRFWQNVAATADAFALAVAFSLGGGLAIGLLLGLSRFAGDVFDPILNALTAIPKITLYPVILLFFGLGLSAKVAFGTIHGIFPVIILTMNGVRNISPVVRKAARVMRLTPAQTIRCVLLPAALPEIFSGMRIGVSLALLGTLVGELFASDRGIGFMLIQSVEHSDVPTVMALTLLLFAVAVIGGLAMLQIDRRLRREG
jgi:NitT/TauT family transport system permease protein